MLRYIFPVSFLLFFSACTKKEYGPAPTETSTFRSTGLDVAWNPVNGDCIAYSIKEADGFYDIHLTNESGTADKCITCDHPDLPNKHICCPFWDPTGKWIMFVVEKEVHPGSSTDALPGFGAYCDIWIMDSTATNLYKVVDIPNDYDHGVIAPRFSPDGNKIIWTDRESAPNFLDPHKTAGYWTINVGDIAFTGIDSIPIVSNVIELKPGGNAFYEEYGFSPDGSRIIFCSNMNKPSFFDEHIYTMDISGGDIVPLTDKDYNEHAFYNPTGNKIVWMSNKEATKGGTDWWMMNADGSEKIRLTFFNEPDHPQYAGQAVWCGLGSFHPSGNRFLGGVQLDLVTQEGKIMKVILL